MQDDILFEIRRENLETGMRGYPVGYCTTSFVDPLKGLYYIERPIDELVTQPPEAVIYLLYYGHPGSPSDLSAFRAELAQRGTVSSEVLDAIRKLPRKGSPMKLLANALLLTGMLEGTGDYRADCLSLIAKLPQLVATVINHHAGWHNGAQPHRDHSYVERFLEQLHMPQGTSPDFLEVMKLFFIAHMDHGGGNLSTFVGKAVASGLEDMYGSIAASMLALEGPRHGRANQDCLEFVQQMVQELGEKPSAAAVESCLRQRLERGDLVFGFGHAVLRVEDPRAALFYEWAGRKYPSHPLVKMALLLRQVGPAVLAENPKISDPHPNVDAVSGVALTAAGFGWPEYFPVLFGFARIVGISRQIVYERLEARGGKGTPIIRPRYFFQGREDVAG